MIIKFMKQIIIFLFVLLITSTFGSFPAMASTTVRTGQSVSISEQQVVGGDFYALGNSVTMSGKIEGDFQVLAGNVTLNGQVDNDILVIGGTVSIHAAVLGDVRVVAGDVTIADSVSGNVAVLGGRLTILSTANIGGDVLFYGGEAVIDGNINGQVIGNADSVRIDGAVKGGINVTARNLTLGERADIGANIQYISSSELVRAAGAVITGDIVRNDAESESNPGFPVRTLATSFLMSLFATLSLFLVFRRPLTQFVSTGINSFGIKILIGFAVIILTPIIISILLVSVLGMFIGLIGLFVFLLGLFVALPLMNVVFGAMMAKLILKRYEVSALWVSLGTLIVQLLLFIPFLGMPIFIALLLGTLGSIVSIIYLRIR